MSERKEKLNLPNIGGELAARVIPEKPVHSDDKKKRDQFAWEVRIVIPGPDSRFNAGIARISAKRLNDFIEVMERSLAKIEALRKLSFSGEFSDVIDGFQNPQIQIQASSGRIYANFWMLNNTKWKFSRVLNDGDIRSIIEILKSVEIRGRNLVKTLKRIHA